MSEGFDRIHEECGVFGVYDVEGHNVAPMVYYGSPRTEAEISA